MHNGFLKWVFTALVCCVLSTPSFADLYSPTTDCVFAVITQKRGIASGLAHNHFVSHKLKGATINADLVKPLQSTFVSEFNVSELSFDDYDQIEKWKPGLVGIEGLSPIFSKISQDDREEIRAHALAESQLNAKTYSTGKIELKELKESSLPTFERFKHTAAADMTLAGKKFEIQVALNFSFEDQSLNFEGIGKSAFSNFGIEPYSAFLGAVGNQDQFFIYTKCRANRVSE